MEVKNGKNIMGLPKAGKNCGDIKDARCPSSSYVMEQRVMDGDYLSRQDGIAVSDAAKLRRSMNKDY